MWNSKSFILFVLFFFSSFLCFALLPPHCRTWTATAQILLYKIIIFINISHIFCVETLCYFCCCCCKFVRTLQNGQMNVVHDSVFFFYFVAFCIWVTGHCSRWVETHAHENIWNKHWIMEWRKNHVWFIGLQATSRCLNLSWSAWLFVLFTI